jgi:hypothetical protein
MKIKNIKKIVGILIILLISIPTVFGISSFHTRQEPLQKGMNTLADIDPLIDIEVTFDLKAIRSLEKHDIQIPAIEKIDATGNPDFYVKIFINDEEFTSPIWHDTKYVYNPDWSVTLNVPDEDEYVNIIIQLWDFNPNGDKLCDISPFNNELPDTYEVNLRYSTRTGHWRGDDYCSYEPSSFDSSGYGRLNGCDDGSIYQKDMDCELWFDIYQNDYDNDGIPYWTETEIYKTDPTVNDRGRDDDNDFIPIEWEHKWGHYYERHSGHYWYYNPFVWENHTILDPDGDGLSNIIEYQMEEWGTDPFRKDVFVELDVMESDANGQVICFPTASEELLYTAFNRQNVILHLDSGCMGGSDIIPYDELTDYDELRDMYDNYFLHNDENNARGGIFHYGVMVYCAQGASGFVFQPDAFQISLKGMLDKKIQFPWLQQDVIFASAYMHELGHTFDFNPIPGHNEDCYYPLQIGWWLVGSYKSCMNYRYMYYTVDYSDGSRGKNDFDDWERMDMTYFQRYWG